jgi:tetratricopeptide (TPR) repeat protein
VGDPLCAPFPRKTLAPSDIDKGLDSATELPALFSARRLQVLTAANPAVKPESLKIMMRADARIAKQDKPGARKALEDATALDDRLVTAQTMLAGLYEEAAEYDKAIDCYRRILAVTPNDPIALNNLAYGLATRKNQPGDALPLAQKAFTLANGSPTVADTLGWVQHLLGNQTEAYRLIAAAARALPRNAEVRFHLAAVLAAVGSLDSARTALGEAIKLDPEFEKRDEVKALRAKLKLP